MTLEQLLTYRPPTPDDLVKHRTLGDAQRVCQAELLRAYSTGTFPENFQVIQQATLDFGRVIEATAPDGPDRDRAIEHLVLARVAANEALVNPDPFGPLAPKAAMIQLAVEETYRARWLASKALAMAGAL